MHPNTSAGIGYVLAFLVTETVVFAASLIAFHYTWLWPRAIRIYKRREIGDVEESVQALTSYYYDSYIFWTSLLVITSLISIKLVRDTHWRIYGGSGKLGEVKFLSRHK